MAQITELSLQFLLNILKLLKQQIMLQKQKMNSQFFCKTKKPQQTVIPCKEKLLAKAFLYILAFTQLCVIRTLIYKEGILDLPELCFSSTKIFVINDLFSCINLASCLIYFFQNRQSLKEHCCLRVIQKPTSIDFLDLI